MQITTWGKSQFSYGWEIRIDIVEDDGKIWNFTYGFDNEPTEEEIENAIQEKLDYIQLIKPTIHEVVSEVI